MIILRELYYVAWRNLMEKFITSFSIKVYVMSVVNQSQNNEEVDVQQLIPTGMFCSWADSCHVTNQHVQGECGHANVKSVEMIHSLGSNYWGNFSEFVSHAIIQSHLQLCYHRSMN